MSTTKSNRSKNGDLTRRTSMAADVWRKLSQRVKSRGGNKEDMDHLGSKEGEKILDKIADRLITIGLIQRNHYPVKAHYQSFSDALAAGKYGIVDAHITAKNFKIEAGEIIVDTEITLYHPDGEVESDDVIRELDRMGLRPATLPELCAFGEKYPSIQRKLCIISLGSVSVLPNGWRRVTCLWNRGGPGRGLYIIPWGEEWGPTEHFAAVPR